MTAKDLKDIITVAILAGAFVGAVAAFMKGWSQNTIPNIIKETFKTINVTVTHTEEAIKELKSDSKEITKIKISLVEINSRIKALERGKIKINNVVKQLNLTLGAIRQLDIRVNELRKLNRMIAEMNKEPILDGDITDFLERQKNTPIVEEETRQQPAQLE